MYCEVVNHLLELWATDDIMARTYSEFMFYKAVEHLFTRFYQRIMYLENEVHEKLRQICLQCIFVER